MQIILRKQNAALKLFSCILFSIIGLIFSAVFVQTGPPQCTGLENNDIENLIRLKLDLNFQRDYKRFNADYKRLIIYIGIWFGP